MKRYILYTIVGAIIFGAIWRWHYVTFAQRSQITKDYVLRKHLPKPPNVSICTRIDLKNYRYGCTTTLTNENKYITKKDWKYLRDTMYTISPDNFNSIKEYMHTINKLKSSPQTVE